MSSIKIKLRVKDDSEEPTNPAYIIETKVPSLNELVVLQLVEEILDDCFTKAKISYIKLEEELEKIKQSY